MTRIGSQPPLYAPKGDSSLGGAREAIGPVASIAILVRRPDFSNRAGRQEFERWDGMMLRTLHSGPQATPRSRQLRPRRR